jgi:hypothetical protein
MELNKISHHIISLTVTPPRYITDYEGAYLRNVSALNASIERLKKMRRERQDEKKQVWGGLCVCGCGCV